MCIVVPLAFGFRGPLHFVGNSQRYDMKSSLKHRLLTKQGWQVHHIAWNVAKLQLDSADLSSEFKHFSFFLTGSAIGLARAPSQPHELRGQAGRAFPTPPVV